MKNRPPRVSTPWWRRLIIPALALAASGAVRAADLHLQATLILGANESPAASNYKLADQQLADRLRSCKALQWTNYFEITNLTAQIPLHQSRDVKMSDRCTLKISNLGSSQIAIDCIAHGKQISRGTNTLPFILGSDDTNNTAWFVSLQAIAASR